MQSQARRNAARARQAMGASRSGHKEQERAPLSVDGWATEQPNANRDQYRRRAALSSLLAPSLKKRPIRFIQPRHTRARTSRRKIRKNGGVCSRSSRGKLALGWRGVGGVGGRVGWQCKLLHRRSLSQDVEMRSQDGCREEKEASATRSGSTRWFIRSRENFRVRAASALHEPVVDESSVVLHVEAARCSAAPEHICPSLPSTDGPRPLPARTESPLSSTCSPQLAHCALLLRVERRGGSAALHRQSSMARCGQSRCSEGQLQARQPASCIRAAALIPNST